MKIETHLWDVPWSEVGRTAAVAEELGFDSLAQAELKRDPFVPLALAAASTSRIALATSVAIAFPRSPMVVAYTARNLHDLSGGRFVLGLGTQVKGHIERRFSTVWDSPGPRLREYIQALRAIWEAWQTGAPLNYQGRFYQFSLMTPEFSPPPSEHAPVKIHIAAVNTYNIQLAGELCDGLRVHPFSTPAYTRDVIWSNLVKGARRSGRSLDEFDLMGTGFIATGATEEEVSRAREDARYRIAFYASTRTYLPVLEHHGWQDLNEKLRRLIAENRWDDLSTIIPDDVLDAFCVTGTYDTIVPAVRERLEGLIDWAEIGMPSDPVRDGNAVRGMLAGLRDLSPASGLRESLAAPEEEVARRRARLLRTRHLSRWPTLGVEP
jgi:probable F420-dependent oxidoreductase